MTTEEIQKKATEYENLFANIQIIQGYEMPRRALCECAITFIDACRIEVFESLSSISLIDEPTAVKAINKKIRELTSIKQELASRLK